MNAAAPALETAASRAPLAVAAGPISADPGGGFACGLGAAGELYCWGANALGQLGLGAALQPDVAVPTRVDAAAWTAVSAGAQHACGITGGALFCWGANTRGQLGDGTINNRPTPTRVGTAGDWSAVSAGATHTCGRRGPAVYCWGGNTQGQLGNGTTADARAPALVGGAFAAVVAGGAHTCAIAAVGGGLSCWGGNTNGQLGLAGAGNRTTPAVVSATDVFLGVDAGGAHTCALRNDGTLWCTGANAGGQLGDGSTTDRTALTRVGSASDWSAIATGTAHTCGLSTTGQLRCFGSNTRGETGLGSAPRVVTPTVVSASSFTTVSAGGGTCASGSAGLVCFGPNRSGELGAGVASRRGGLGEVAQGHGGQVARAAFGQQHGCIVRIDGSLWCSGDNASGQLGTGDGLPRASFTRVGADNDWALVSSGQLHTCATRTDGRAACWGSNAFGQLGDGTTVSRPTPVELAGLWQRVVAGQSHSCGLRQSDGALFCWGLNDSGRLGDGTTINRSTPVRAGAATGYIALALGDGHSCGLLPGGGVDCFGFGGYGALGRGNTLSSWVPVRSFNGAVAIATGASTTCAINGTAQLWCWGLSHLFQAGSNVTAVTSPTQLSGGGTWTQLAMSTFHTCGVRSGATVCFGSNSSGQLGDTTVVNRISPVVAGNFVPTSLALGFEQSCAVRADGTLWCAGFGGDGQLGDHRAWVATAAASGCATATHGCAANATCVDAASGPTCPCPAGLVGDGLASGTGCTLPPADPCLTGNGGCSADATCTNTAPGARSCACNAGYAGDGVTCSAIDLCLTGNGGCSADATCTMTGPGARSCTCSAGFTGDGVTCADVDECATNNGGCAASASCTNTVGSWSCATPCQMANGGCSADATCDASSGATICTCRAGFTGDGVTCADVNECATDNGGCSANATCTNTLGARSCACAAGFSGDGVTCAVVCGDGRRGPDEACDDGNTVGGDGCSATCLVEVDLALTQVTLDQPTLPGGQAPVEFTVCNVGAFPATYSVEWYLSADESIDVGDDFFDLTTVISHAYFHVVPGQCQTELVTLNVPASALPDAFLGGRVRANWPAVDVQPINDDRFAGRLNGVVGPDLGITSIQLVDTGNPDLLAATVEVCNVGDQPGVATPSLRVSVDAVIESTDLVEPTPGQPMSLDPGLCGTTTRYLFLPLLPAPVVGTYFLGALLEHAQDDADESNDSLTYPTSLSFPRVICSFGNGGCSADATCTEQLGVGVSCACNAGYTGNGFTCTDVNECAANNGGCSASATCTNTPGAWSCACNAGYTGDGFTCADVNECATNNGGCSANAACTNTVGGRACMCNADYTGDGVTCTAIAPVLVGLSPAQVFAHALAQTITVNGSDFSSGASVEVDGVAQPTVFVSSNQLSATLPPGAALTAGVRQVRVVNATGAVSAALPLTVIAGTVTVTDMVPARVRATSGSNVIRLTGTGFTSQTRIRVDGGAPIVPFDVTATSLRFNVVVAGFVEARMWGVAVTNGEAVGETDTVLLEVDALDTSPRTLAASTHTCRVYPNGTVRCAGANGSGEIGDGTFVARLTPTLVSGLSDAVEVAVGAAHSCARHADGRVSCWGSNSNGQLGTGSLTPSRVALPGFVSGITTAVEIAAGSQSACARLADATVRCWGANGAGQLGNGTINQSPLPVQVSGLSDAVEIDAGQAHTCARHNDGGVSCWGINAEGQLGRGNTTASSVPVRVPSLASVVNIDLGVRHTCARGDDGTVRCWGMNTDGQLGIASFQNRTSPVVVASNAIGVGTGYRATCIINNTGTVSCAGGLTSTDYLLAAGLSPRTSNVFVQSLLSGVRRITTFSLRHFCALREDDVVQCWGTELSGSMGLGAANANRASPVTSGF